MTSSVPLIISLHTLTNPNNITTTGTPATLDDLALSKWLRERHTDGHMVTLVYSRHRCKVYSGDVANEQLLPADPDKESLKELQILARIGRLKRLELPYDDLQQAAHVSPDWVAQSLSASLEDVKTWHKGRQAVFGRGRGRNLSKNDIKLVWHEAGGRCMYRGCGKDLGSTSLTTTSAQTAYLAHIIASDADGPRGDPVHSPILSDDPGNIMLMCDAHHRLIDRIDEDGHPADLLRVMRAEHVQMVRSALNALAYPRTQGVTFLADLANVKTSVSERDMRKAMLGRQLAPMPGIDYLVRRTHRDDRLSPNFWYTLLHEHEPDLQELIRRLGCSQPLGDRYEALSVFPLHLVPILVLCGRIMGEARWIEVFQYDRHRASWQWESTAIPQHVDTFQLEAPPTVPANEVLLSLELTAPIDENALPVAIANQARAGSMPWLRITASNPDSGCIRHPDDLAQFTLVARQAISMIHDQMHAKHVHVLGVSPASTLFRFGQLLQAGHHSAYTIYDRPDRTQPFQPGLIIDGQKVVNATVSGDATTKVIQLR